MISPERLQKFNGELIRYRWVIFFGIILFTCGLAYSIQFLKVNNDYDSWLPGNDKVAELVREVDRKYSNNTLVFIVVDFSEKGVFHRDSLAVIQRLTGELEGIRELFNVTSLTNIVDIRKTEDGIEVGDLVSDLPESDEESARLEAYVLDNEMYVDSVVSADGNFTVIITNIDTVYDEVGISKLVVDKAREVLGDLPCYFGGDPVMNYYLDMYVKEDFSRLVPAMLALMVFVLWFGLRRFTGVILALTFVIVTVLWTFGLTALLKYPFNILSPPVAVMLIAVGSDYVVHIYNHYQKRRDIIKAMSEISMPVIMSALTTIIGLLTFATTKIMSLKYFGVELALGLASACFLAIILLPVCVYIFKAKSSTVPALNKKDADIKEHVFSRVLVQYSDWAYHHAALVIVCTCLFMVIMGFGISRISTSVEYVTLLPEESPPRQGTDIIVEHFGGIYPNNIHFQGDLQDPALMAQLQYVENYLHARTELSGFRSIAGYIAQENWLLNGVYAIPETREGIANLWFMLEGEEAMKTIVTSDRDGGLVSAMTKKSATGEMAELSRNIKAFLEAEGGHRACRIEPALLDERGQRQLASFRLKHAARQLAWLAEGYDNGNRYEFLSIMEKLDKSVEALDQEVNLIPVLKTVLDYFKNETVEILPPELIKRLTEYTRTYWADRKTRDFTAQLEQMIVAARAMDSEDAQLTIKGMLKRAEDSLRLLQTATLQKALSGILPERLWQDKHYHKRAGGILWSLLSPQPVFFFRQVEAISGIDQAVVGSTELKVNQAGVPEILTRLDTLLVQSQLRSLLLASVVVFILISLTQFSLRRGLVSLISVLAPLEMIMGMLGWVGIPLDFGTVLFGALVIGLGIDGSIHFIHYYNEMRNEGLETEQALQATMGHVGKAVVTANATTSVGFFILLLSRTAALQHFAFACGTAIILVTISILILLPALIAVIRLDKKA